jgi:hypothetical protein
MFCFLLRLLLCHAPLVSATFTRISVKSGHPIQISLNGRTAVVVDAPPNSFNYSLTAFDSQTFDHAQRGGHLLVRGEALTVRSLVRRLDLPLWLLPDGVCCSELGALSGEFTGSRTIAGSQKIAH